jgi:hypothetical protein
MKDQNTISNTDEKLAHERLLETGRILHLTLKKKWFDMIASGEKKEEYRDMKPYWTKRLFNDLGDRFEPKSFDKVVFKNGYATNAPTIVVECLGIQKDLGMMTWGAEQDVEYYIIQLGNILFRSSR